MSHFPVTTSRVVDPAPSSRTGATALGRIKERRAELIILAALALNVLEGAIRKWVFGSGGGPINHLVYFSKDFVFALLLFLPARVEESPALKVFRRWLLPGCLLLGFGALLSALRGFNIVGAALTLRAVILLPLLGLYVAPRITKVKGDALQSAVWLLAALTVANFALGIVQNSLPAGHPLNRYASDSLDITELASGVRATGTFSYITGMSVISTVGIWAGLMLINVSKNMRTQIAALTVIGSGFGCGLASVSRGPIIAGLAMIVIWLLLSGAKSLLNFSSVIAGVLFVALALILGVSSKFSSLQEGLLERHETAGDSLEGRSFGQLQEAIEVLGMAPLGMGLGKEQIGGNYYVSGEMKFTTYENQLPRLVLETGVAGLIGFILVCAGAILALQVAKRNATTRSQKAILLTTQLTLLPLFYINVVFNHTASAFVWMIFTAVISSQYHLGKAVPETFARRRR
jgi:O-antigen ligase/polysaccharide polymerase Wzy-like membrane protein